MTPNLDPFLFSHLSSDVTGIQGVVLWAPSCEIAGAGADLGPRLLVTVGEHARTDVLKAALTVTLDDPPRFEGDLPVDAREAVVRLAHLHHDVLLRHWRGETSTRELVNAITGA